MFAGLVLLSMVWRLGFMTVHGCLWIAGVTLIGGILDSLLGWIGHIDFRYSRLPPWVAPPWLLLIWAAFAVVVAVMARLFHRFFCLSVLLMPIAVSLTYYLGYRLGAVDMKTPLETAVTIYLIWLILTPVLIIGRLGFERRFPVAEGTT